MAHVPSRAEVGTESEMDEYLHHQRSNTADSDDLSAVPLATNNTNAWHRRLDDGINSTFKSRPHFKINFLGYYRPNRSHFDRRKCLRFDFDAEAQFDVSELVAFQSWVAQNKSELSEIKGLLIYAHGDKPVRLDVVSRLLFNLSKAEIKLTMFQLQVHSQLNSKKILSCDCFDLDVFSTMLDRNVSDLNYFRWDADLRIAERESEMCVPYVSKLFDTITNNWHEWDETDYLEVSSDSFMLYVSSVSLKEFVVDCDIKCKVRFGCHDDDRCLQSLVDKICGYTSDGIGTDNVLVLHYHSGKSQDAVCKLFRENTCFYQVTYQMIGHGQRCIATTMFPVWRAIFEGTVQFVKLNVVCDITDDESTEVMALIETVLKDKNEMLKEFNLCYDNEDDNSNKVAIMARIQPILDLNYENFRAARQKRMMDRYKNVKVSRLYY